MPFGLLDVAPWLMWGVLAYLIAMGLRPWWAALAVTLVFGVGWGIFSALGGEAPSDASMLVQNDALLGGLMLLLTPILMVHSQETYRLMDALNMLLQRRWLWFLALGMVLGWEVGVQGEEGLAGHALALLFVSLGLILLPYWLIQQSVRNRYFRYYLAFAIVLWSISTSLPFFVHKTAYVGLCALCIYGALHERRLQQVLAGETSQHSPGLGYLFIAGCWVFGLGGMRFLMAYMASEPDLSKLAWQQDERVLLVGALALAVAMLLSLLNRWSPKTLLAPAALQVGRASFVLAPFYFSFSAIYLGIATPSEGAFACWMWMMVFVACRRRLSWAMVWGSVRQWANIVWLFLVMTLGFNIVVSGLLAQSPWGVALLNGDYSFSP